MQTMIGKTFFFFFSFSKGVVGRWRIAEMWKNEKNYLLQRSILNLCCKCKSRGLLSCFFFFSVMNYPFSIRILFAQNIPSLPLEVKHVIYDIIVARLNCFTDYFVNTFSNDTLEVRHMWRSWRRVKTTVL